MTTSKHRKGANSIERVAGNGLLDRRALLSHGAALAGAMGVGATGAAAEPLAVEPRRHPVGRHRNPGCEGPRIDAKRLAIPDTDPDNHNLLIQIGKPHV